MYDKEYKSLWLRLGFALLLMFVLLQTLMTLLGLSQLVLDAFLIEKASNTVYWSLYNVLYFVSFVLPVPFFLLISGKNKPRGMFFRISFPKYFWLISLAFVGLITAAGQLNAFLLMPFGGEGGGSTDVLLDLISRGNGYMVVLVFVMLVIVPPFCEELLFRGLVLGNLLPYGKGVAVVGSALLFAAMHQSFSQFLYTAVAGILLGVLYVHSRSIWPSTLVHMLNNLLAFAQLIIASRVQDQRLASYLVIGSNLAVILAGFVCMLVLVFKHGKQKKQVDLSGGAFGSVPDRTYFEKPRELSRGMVVRGFFSPSVVLYLVLCIGMAGLNLLLETLI